MSIARLYGRQSTNSSLSVVTEGFRQVMLEAGVLAGRYGVDRLYDLDDEPLDGADALYGVYTGPLDRIEVMFEAGRHEHFWIMVAPNSDLLPQHLIEQIKRLQTSHPHRVHLMAPSTWAAGQVSKHTLSAVCIVPHGVDSAYRPNQELGRDLDARYQAGEFRVLHLSTSDRSRKGTVELIEAWMGWTADRPQAARLMCIMDYPAKTALTERLIDQGIKIDWSVQLMDRADLPPESMARVLGSAHVVCQPSRGEAFGLVPLQALCAGVPIIATTCTGHSEYLGRPSGLPGLIEVRTLPDEPLDDLPGSQAPGIRPESIREALEFAHRNYQAFKIGTMQNAAELGEKWSWSNQLRRFIQALGTTQETAQQIAGRLL